jgi:hypothetical protein
VSSDQSSDQSSDHSGALEHAGVPHRGVTAGAAAMWAVP